MKEQNQDTRPKICPLLNINPENTDIDCMERLCAWFIQNPHGGGYCAIAALAGIGRG